MSGRPADDGGRSRGVRITTHPLWRLRLARELPRYLLCVLLLLGVAASVRFLLSAQRPVVAASVARETVRADRAAEGFAVLFARRYLSWNAEEPQASQSALQPFMGPGMESDAGLELPVSGQQRVEWAEVVQARAPSSGMHVYTVAAETEPSGLLYLTVGVVRTASGLAIDGYPAFVGAPAAAPAEFAARVSEVDEPALATVITRALRNYLAGSEGELAADLTAGARVSLPALTLELDSVQRLDWTSAGSSVLALLQAQDARGARYTLAYELDVAREQGRWEVSAVQMDPDA